MHGSFERPRGFECRSITLPTYEEHEVRAAVTGPDGGESFLDKQDCAFLLDNPVEEAALAAARLVREAAQLEGELSSARRNLDRTPPTLCCAAERAPISSLNLALGVLFGVASVTGMAVSVVVLTEYALQSASGLFNHPLAAVLFAMLPSLGAISLKSVEARLESPRQRWNFVVGLALLGLASLAVWLWAAALALAPETANPAAALIEGGTNRTPGMILIITTVICDTAFGAVLLSGATYWLTAPTTAEQVPNPAHVAATEEKHRLEARLTECRREHEKVQDYLRRAAAGRALTRHLAEYAINRAREQFMEGQVAARAFFTALFLSKGTNP